MEPEAQTINDRIALQIGQLVISLTQMTVRAEINAAHANNALTKVEELERQIAEQDDAATAATLVAPPPLTGKEIDAKLRRPVLKSNGADDPSADTKNY